MRHRFSFGCGQIAVTQRRVRLDFPRVAKLIARTSYGARMSRGKQVFTLSNATRAAKALRAAGFNDVSIDSATGIVRGIVTTGSTTVSGGALTGWEGVSSLVPKP